MKIANTLLAASMLAMAVTPDAFAKPARRGDYTINQPDGTTVTLTKTGDERGHAWLTTDGWRVAPDAEGTYRFMASDGTLSAIRACNPGERTQALTTFLENAGARLADLPLVSNAARAASLDRQPRASQVPTMGSPKVPILLVQYTDIKFRDSDPLATFTNFFDNGSKSAHQYFLDQSNGLYDASFDVYGPYTLPNKRSTYGGNDRQGYDKAVGQMVAEACQGLNSKVNFKQYDNDGDGEADVVIVLYAGVGEADSDVANSVWPCQWDLYSSDYGKSLTLDGVTVDRFAVFNELFGPDPREIDGVGTFAHEFSHCLGLPDFYDTRSTSNPNYGMDAWSLMDYGCYNDDGYTPLGYSAYEKEFMGWMTIDEGAPNTYYTLEPLSTGNDRAVRLTNDLNSNEYYIIENRARQGWDAYMEAEGLLIYHVDYQASAWENNTVNNTSSHQRMTPVPADNKLDIDSNAGDLWPYGGNNALTDDSKPAAKVFVGGYLSKPVTEMSVAGNGNASFWVMRGSGIDAPEAAAAGLGEGSSSWFDMQGRALEQRPTLPGLYIVKAADGEARKVRL